MSRGLALWMLSAGALLGAPACDEQAPVPAPVDVIASIRAECRKLAAVLCESTALCLPVSFGTSYGSHETCLERQTSLCEGTRFGVGSRETPASVARCAEAWQDVLSGLKTADRCRTWLRREVERNPPTECLLAGTLPEGARCLDGSQCSSGTCAKGVVCGTCRPPAKAGEDCFEDADCAPALACASQICVAYGDLGAECGRHAPCHPDLACRSEDGSRRCRTRRTLGEPCDPDGDDCELFDPELACNTVERRCEPYRTARDAQACGELPLERGQPSPGSVAVCPQGQRCKTEWFHRKSGRCEPAVPDRWPCIERFPLLRAPHPLGSECRAPAICVDQRCQIPDTAACGPGAPP